MKRSLLTSPRSAGARAFLVIALAIMLLSHDSVLAQQASNSALGVGSSQEKEEAAPWQFSLKPYVFLSGVTGSITAGPVTFPINSSFSALLDNLRFGGFVSLDATKGKWGFIFDLEYVSLIGKGSGLIPLELRLDNLFIELDASFNPTNASSLRFVGGARLYDIDQFLTISDQPKVESSTTVVDPILGAIGTWNLGERWWFEFRGDIGGFGISSEFTYQLMLEFQWRISESVGIPFGYRILGYQIRQESIWLNTRLSGMFLGLDFCF